VSDVAIIDYGLCNLDSIRRAIEECGGAPLVTNDPGDLDTCDRIVLPGVGSFARAMANLRAAGLDEALVRCVRDDGIPILGICLGMQLLAEHGTEGGDTEGLGLIGGRVERLTPHAKERVPHIGWNDLELAAPSPLFDGIAPGTDFYFVHSHRLVGPEDERLATVDYCGTTVAAAGRDHIMAVQFHPEKSQTSGFHLLRNFLGYRC
jgi:glutamine amidotransferase